MREQADIVHTPVAEPGHGPDGFPVPLDPVESAEQTYHKVVGAETELLADLVAAVGVKGELGRVHAAVDEPESLAGKCACA